MARPDDIDDPRRGLLIAMLAAGLFGAAPWPARAAIFGQVPKQMPPGRSIYDLSGQVMVNGKAAGPGTIIGPNDVVETMARSRAVFVVGKDAFLLRDRSRLELSGTRVLVNTLRLLSGKLLSVFGRSEHRLDTATATIGIRGTGLYVEADPELTYACTCYGVTNIAATADSSAAETIDSQHHDAPRYIAAGGGRLIQPAPFKNHSDEELWLIEALVGRTPSFGFRGGDYDRLRRDAY